MTGRCKFPEMRGTSKSSLVGGLEHDFDFPIQLGISEGLKLNHQPDLFEWDFPLKTIQGFWGTTIYGSHGLGQEIQLPSDIIEEDHGTNQGDVGPWLVPSGDVKMA